VEALEICFLDRSLRRTLAPETDHTLDDVEWDYGATELLVIAMRIAIPRIN